MVEHVGHIASKVTLAATELLMEGACVGFVGQTLAQVLDKRDVEAIAHAVVVELKLGAHEVDTSRGSIDVRLYSQRGLRAGKEFQLEAAADES